MSRFIDAPDLRQRISAVLASLPPEVVSDIVNDDRFRMAVYDVRDPAGNSLHFAPPGVGNNGSRMIAWKSSLSTAPLEFANYVIAHEFAHAWLRNRGRTTDEDPEDAADALAREWGYEKPESARRFTWWRRS
ncbi:MAG: hypothetical protein ONB48_14345 [candidate division KSB1 bacterium]|nr:hypothetical protein [candidate division KSB1 bacterium]MDZ7273583.1 hypothetical protein [candidate division KSB1 bacterium]MDZ7286826.1 hypothetical protein [candidate division KSB1 bacterium]MDZ7299817.1 hypothetical protein [candidate division KSB1 bacterium]MDZ7308458.1 hypothetical protein [candidate division KSB1 bacterium]